jgi:outer membrane protein TolC
MERRARSGIAVAVLLLAWGPLPCPAQDQPPPPAQASPPAAPGGGQAEQARSASDGNSQAPPPLPSTLPESTLRPGEPKGPPTPPWQKSNLQRPAPPGGEVVEVKPPPLEPGDLRFPINLATALRLADARPLVVVAAQASAWVAEANLQKAKVLWVPTVNFAADYIRHDGIGPDLNNGQIIPPQTNALGQFEAGLPGKPLNQNINFFYGGGGFTLAPSTPNYFFQPDPSSALLPAPMMQYLTDIIFEPLRQRQNLNAARWDIQTAKNDALYQTAHAYFTVHRWRGMYAVNIDVVQRGRQLVAEIAELSRDLVSAAEIDRARNLLADLEQAAVASRQQWRVASADLTRVLRLDPRAVVEPLEHDHAQITLIDPGRTLDDLIPIGLTNRPELAAHQAMVQATLVAIRREKMRPLVPSLLINGLQTPMELIEVGGIGIGNGGKLNNWGSRDDISPQVLWTADGMGLSNLARVKRQRGMASAQIVELFRLQDKVAAEVTRAQADVQSAAARVSQAERELRAAIINYNGNVEGLKQTRRFRNLLEQIFRPQEAVFALQLLWAAYGNYITTVAEYNISQFELFHALGYPSRELAFMRKPGEILPVDTSRPAYLPPVGTGPPPATR